jgi:hypothetical protein
MGKPPSFSPPPTKYGPAGPMQAKPRDAVPEGRRLPPPPTRFGTPTAAQLKAAVPASPAPPARLPATPVARPAPRPDRVIQRMEAMEVEAPKRETSDPNYNEPADYAGRVGRHPEGVTKQSVIDTGFMANDNETTLIAKLNGKYFGAYRSGTLGHAEDLFLADLNAFVKTVERGREMVTAKGGENKVSLLISKSSCEHCTPKIQQRQQIEGHTFYIRMAINNVYQGGMDHLEGGKRQILAMMNAGVPVKSKAATPMQQNRFINVVERFNAEKGKKLPTAPADWRWRNMDFR